MADLQGSYTGTWRSGTYGASGSAVLTIAVVGQNLEGNVVLLGSPIGYRGDALSLRARQTGNDLWTVEFEGKNSKLSGTGVFRGRRFIGDYHYARWLLGVDDRGQWILDK